MGSAWRIGNQWVPTRSERDTFLSDHQHSLEVHRPGVHRSWQRLKLKQGLGWKSVDRTQLPLTWRGDMGQKLKIKNKWQSAHQMVGSIISFTQRSLPNANSQDHTHTDTHTHWLPHAGMYEQEIRWFFSGKIEYPRNKDFHIWHLVVSPIQMGRAQHNSQSFNSHFWYFTFQHEQSRKSLSYKREQNTHTHTHKSTRHSHTQLGENGRNMYHEEQKNFKENKTLYKKGGIHLMTCLSGEQI